jgi:hypothetical protein
MLGQYTSLRISVPNYHLLLWLKFYPMMKVKQSDMVRVRIRIRIRVRVRVRVR